MSRRPSDYQRICVKIGSALLVDENGLRREWLQSLCDDLKMLTDAGKEVIVVSSGSIALGRRVLGLPKGLLKLEQAQAAAAVGQIALAQAYSEILRERDLSAGQILLTLQDTEERRRYLNARETIGTLLKLKAVPIINENDSVATNEIRYGDNDRLGARVATMASADLLVLLSDIDGLYTAPPQQNPDAVFLPEVPQITPKIEAMAGSAGSAMASGGMKTKIDAGKIAQAAGTTMAICSGKVMNPLQALENGTRSTWFPAQDSPTKARKRWISGHLKPTGVVHLDNGALKAVRAGKSLLPAGITATEGAFRRGDAVQLQDTQGNDVGRGLITYDFGEAALLIGRNSTEIEAILGHPGRAEMIHRDDLVLTPDCSSDS
ncbi:glutamate 5-kinase [Polycladidibacter stylochi]|uniref:glutamate 5-kinase n=1 Tax=Polycladidibacter stylochi TaxID=1807766 RepID=UPI00082B8BF3|nr:glutamate 5-kinase [Pseudovibrio stylochi]